MGPETLATYYFLFYRELRASQAQKKNKFYVASDIKFLLLSIFIKSVLKESITTHYKRFIKIVNHLRLDIIYVVYDLRLVQVCES